MINFQPMTSEQYGELIERPFKLIESGDLAGAEEAMCAVRHYEKNAPNTCVHSAIRLLLIQSARTREGANVSVEDDINTIESGTAEKTSALRAALINSLRVAERNVHGYVVKCWRPESGGYEYVFGNARFKCSTMMGLHDDLPDEFLLVEFMPWWRSIWKAANDRN